MTIAELERFIQSRNRVNRAKAKEKAALDYILSNLIGINVMHSMSTSVELPTLQEAYSFLFGEEAAKIEEEKRAKATELSTLRFKQFAKSYNKKFKQEV